MQPNALSDAGARGRTPGRGWRAYTAHHQPGPCGLPLAPGCARGRAPVGPGRGPGGQRARLQSAPSDLAFRLWRREA